MIGRYRNLTILALVICMQVVGLGVQLRKTDDGDSARLIQYWAIATITPPERAVVGTGHWFRNAWHNYVDLRGVRSENQQLKAEVERMRLEQVRVTQDAA